MIPASNNQEREKEGTGPGVPVIRVWALAGELGLLIVIPLLILLLIGIRLDRSFGTTPLFIIAGLILSFVVSAIAIARKVKKVQVL
jgi:F0F1-type ATP synthase assembly protein I